MIVLLLLIWIVSDLILTHIDPLKYTPYIAKNDFEITMLAHPEKKLDKVLYGSSAVVSAYREDLSRSGYVNFGIDYGTVSDIYQMLAKGKIKISGDLVIALNDISFLDTLPTNPTYPWHKKWYQHYLYFQRDKIYPLFDTAINNILSGQPPIGNPLYGNSRKAIYSGTQSPEELAETVQSKNDRFGSSTVERDCQKNFKDLEKLIRYCKKHNIRLRAVLLPWNPSVPMYEFGQSVNAAAIKAFEQNGIGYYDMTNALNPEHFHDIGHVNYEVGSPYFTQLIDEFLCR